jgi:hypothetical protein
VKGKNKDEVDNEFTNYLKVASAKHQARHQDKKKSAIELFLLSCVDEANSLTLPKQRLFKQKVIEALFELSDDL